MSAQEQMRKMLDELMGTGRDGTKSKDAIEFTDFRVCRAFLLATCPYEVLSSTRMDMGECPKIHDLALRADYEKAQKTRDHFFDLDALDQLERFFEDCDRKTEISKRRLAETQEELSSEASEKANKVLEINEEIGKTLAEAEKLGNEGMVEESLKLMEKVEELKKQKYEADNDYRNSMPASSYQQQKLRVCEVCSAYLGIHDNDRRLADHFGGKLHMGFVFLRERLEELRGKSVDRRAKYEAERKTDRFDRRDDRRGGRGNSSRESFDRNRKSRSSRSRSRERHKDRRRSRSRSKGSKKRSRSRDRSSRTAAGSSRKRSRESRSKSPSSRHSRDEKSGRHRKSRDSEERRKKRSPDERNGKDKERSPPEEGETVDEDDAGSKDSDRPKDSDEDGEI